MRSKKGRRIKKGVHERRSKRDSTRTRCKQVERNWDNKDFHGQQDPEEQRGIMLSGLRLLSALAPVIRHPSIANEGYVKRL